MYEIKPVEQADDLSSGVRRHADSTMKVVVIPANKIRLRIDCSEARNEPRDSMDSCLYASLVLLWRLLTSQLVTCYGSRR